MEKMEESGDGIQETGKTGETGEMIDLEHAGFESKVKWRTGVNVDATFGPLNNDSILWLSSGSFFVVQVESPLVEVYAGMGIYDFSDEMILW